MSAWKGAEGNQGVGSPAGAVLRELLAMGTRCCQGAHRVSKLSFLGSLCRGRVEVIWAGCGGEDCRAFSVVVFLLCATRLLSVVCGEDLHCSVLGFPHWSCDIPQRDLGNGKMSPIPKQFLCWEGRSFLFKGFSLISGNDSARSSNVESGDVALRMAKSNRYSYEQQFSSPRGREEAS